ncbi:glycosyltransferase [Microbacterium murale]|uniref:D-inositol 3-phosphate glycosyltransferase n=1 Tax=Microbacterium murale TaxID=1081040 RepID=A0ABU0PAV2_9MICO|nr:glycosyltransferase [Microbacterium murale]MDQ0644460.1 glycosyltransferase involved in cell wall biosynthesis [Microbacterium murale]
MTGTASPEHPTEPLRVLIATDTFPPDINGAARFARDHAVRLSRRGHDVHVIAPSPTFSGHSGVTMIDDQLIRTHRLRSVKWPAHEWLRIAPPWEVRRRVGRILDEVRPDVVHVQSFIGIGRGVAYEAHLRSIPIVATNHVMPDNLASVGGLPGRIVPAVTRRGWNLAAAVYSRADIVTSPTPIAADYLERSIGLASVTPISCGVDLHRFTPKQAKPGQRSILFVGRLDPEKNLPTLLRAIALLDHDVDAHLDIVGGGSERAVLEQLAEQLGVSTRVRFHGRVTDEQLVALHHEATVFVMPSPAELQSIATLEALASGTPVVLADAMALPHLVHNGVEGYLVPTYSAEEFARQIVKILTLPENDYLTMSAHAVQRAVQHDATTIVRRYEDLYRGAGTRRFARTESARTEYRGRIDSRV